MTTCNNRDHLTDVWNSPMMGSAIWWPLVFAGIAAAATSKGVSGFGTVGMVLRTMSADGIIHSVFGMYSRLIPTCIALVLCVWGNFNVVSKISSYFYLTIFAMINFSLFTAHIARAPSFRPHFTYYSPYVSLVVSIICGIAIFFINWIIAIFCVLLVLTAYLYAKSLKIEPGWGSLDEAFAYNNGLKAALNLQHVPPHEKLYRPNIVFLIDSLIDQHQSAVLFLGQMLRSKGMALVARHFPVDTHLTEIHHIVEDNREKLKIYHVFYEAVVAETKRDAMRKIMLLSGLGVMRPNVIMTEFDETLSSESPDFIGDILDNHWSIILIRRPTIIADFGHIDLWWLSDDGGLCPLIASLLSGTRRNLRIMAVAQTSLNESVAQTARKMKRLTHKFRIKGEIVGMEFSPDQQPTLYIRKVWNQIRGDQPLDKPAQAITKRYMIFADLIRKHSSSALVVVISLPVPKKYYSSELYMQWLALISSAEVPFLFVRGNGTHALSWNL